MSPYFESLHLKAVETAKRYLRAEAEVIDALQKIDANKIFKILKYSSLFEYAVKALKLPENTAYSFIAIARKASQVPELKTAIEAGDIHISNARRIAPILTKENKDFWIKRAQELPQKKLEKELAREFPKIATPEKMDYVTDSRLNLALGISEELSQKLKRVQDLLSQKTRKPATLEDALEELVGEYLDRNDPIEKAKRAERRGKAKSVTWAADTVGDVAIAPTDKKFVEASPSVRNQSVSDVQSSSVGLGARQAFLPLHTNATHVPQREVIHTRTPIPARVKHQVTLRDGGRCTFKNSLGEQCSQTRWLDFHHLKPVSHGGQDTVENLVTLCSTHHKSIHLNI